MIDQIVNFCAPAIAWAKNDIAVWHSKSFFDIFGWAVDKFAFLLGVGICLIAFVVLALLVATLQVHLQEGKNAKREKTRAERFHGPAE